MTSLIKVLFQGLLVWSGYLELLSDIKKRGHHVFKISSKVSIKTNNAGIML